MNTARVKTVRRTGFLLSVATAALFVSAIVLADANDGEYLGYRLGDKFTLPPGAEGEQHITGAMIYEADPGTHPHHIDTISIYVTPGTSIIGSILGEWYFASERAAERFGDRYLAQLASRYTHWRRLDRSLTHGNYQLWVDIERKAPFTERWTSRKPFRVAIGLIYAPESSGRSEWAALVSTEADNLAALRASK